MDETSSKPLEAILETVREQVDFALQDSSMTLALMIDALAINSAF